MRIYIDSEFLCKVVEWKYRLCKVIIKQLSLKDSIRKKRRKYWSFKALLLHLRLKKNSLISPMTFVLTEEERRIFDLLRLEGCCLRCCLRFTGCRNVKYYQDLAELEHLVCCLFHISYIDDRRIRSHLYHVRFVRYNIRK